MKNFWRDFVFRTIACLVCLFFGYYLGRTDGRATVREEWQMARIYEGVVGQVDFAAGSTGAQIPTRLGRDAAVECYLIEGKRHALFFIDTISVQRDHIKVSYQPTSGPGRCLLRKR